MGCCQSAESLQRYVAPTPEKEESMAKVQDETEKASGQTISGISKTISIETDIVDSPESRGPDVSESDFTVTETSDRHEIEHSIFTPKKTKEKINNFQTLAYNAIVRRSKMREELSDRERIEEAFFDLDQSGSGHITRGNLRAVLGVENNQYINFLLEEADHDKDGRISFDEFCSVLQNWLEDSKNRSSISPEDRQSRSQEIIQSYSPDSKGSRKSTKNVAKEFEDRIKQLGGNAAIPLPNLSIEAEDDNSTSDMPNVSVIPVDGNISDATSEAILPPPLTSEEKTDNIPPAEREQPIEEVQEDGHQLDTHEEDEHVLDDVIDGVSSAVVEDVPLETLPAETGSNVITETVDEPSLLLAEESENLDQPMSSNDTTTAAEQSPVDVNEPATLNEIERDPEVTKTTKYDSAEELNPVDGPPHSSEDDPHQTVENASPSQYDDISATVDNPVTQDDTRERDTVAEEVHEESIATDETTTDAGQANTVEENRVQELPAEEEVPTSESVDNDSRDKVTAVEAVDDAKEEAQDDENVCSAETMDDANGVNTTVDEGITEKDDPVANQNETTE